MRRIERSELLGIITYPIFVPFPAVRCQKIWMAEAQFKSISQTAEVKQRYLPFLKQSFPDHVAIVLAEQVHGSKMARAKHQGRIPGVDALSADTPNVALVIRTADCAAIMIYDPVQKVIANLHAGWRGLHQNIIKKSIRYLEQECGCQPFQLFIAVSPFIKACCYRVGSEFRDYFPGKYLTKRASGFYLDMQAVISDQLAEMEIPPSHVYFEEKCTFCDASGFPSFRRTKTENRLLSLIMINTA
jgi:YfiH family protein